MSELNNVVEIHSGDIPYVVLKNAVLQNSGDIAFIASNAEVKRGFHDVEWIAFLILALPVAESVFNVVIGIKNEIKQRVEKQLLNKGIYKRATIKTRIKLPLFLYEKEEEIVVDTTSRNKRR